MSNILPSIKIEIVHIQTPDFSGDQMATKDYLRADLFFGHTHCQLTTEEDIPPNASNNLKLINIFNKIREAFTSPQTL